MASLDRRAFFESVAAAGVGAFAAVRTLQAADALVTVNPSQLGPVIPSHLYGHFIEHLGGVIYDVDHKAHETIDEVLPRTRFAVEAAIQQTAINFR